MEHREPSEPDDRQEAPYCSAEQLGGEGLLPIHGDYQKQTTPIHLFLRLLAVSGRQNEQGKAQRDYVGFKE